jgi:hypothetical protein
MEDRELICRDCGVSFTFHASEQAFFADRGFLTPAGNIIAPVRCHRCRRVSKAVRETKRERARAARW